jgi:2-oxoglutarate ferredoxin oxidoreductase subunit delta
MPKVRVHAEYCKGCGLCLAVCPKKVLYLSSAVNRRGLRIAEVHEEIACSGCVFCANMCPDAAIEVEE